MRRSPILFLIISISIGLLAISCGSTRTVEGYAQTEPVIINYTSSYFSDPATDYVYKANISVYGREFGGIVIIKKISDTAHRVAFTTEFGNKLFDFEITDADFKVNYILEDLDRKIIVNTLRDDFTLLLKKEHPVDKQYKNEGFTVYKSPDGNRFNYLFLDAAENLIKLVHATKSKEKTVLSFIPSKPTLPQNIIIDHKNIKLKIELNYINQ